MKINKIEIKNFRNYQNFSLEFNPNINIFIGNNGEGKTNILESIYFLAITKSHRAVSDKLLITTDKDIMKVCGNVNTLSGNKNMEILVNSKGKKVSINKSILKKISNYISNLVVILFSPDDLDLIKGSPLIRRRFLNIEIGQLNNKYLNYLNEYNELLKNRNEYLKSINIDNINMNYIDIINEQLVEKASYIYKYRFDFIDKLNLYLKNVYSNLTKDDIKIKYANSLSLEKYNDNIKDILLSKLNNSIKRDIFNGSTYYGPHKDDFDIYLNGQLIKDYGSQGQQRLCVISIKFAELEIFKDLKGEYPILLLDDMFSELDIEKRNLIIKYLKNDMQVFITSTDINDIDSNIIKKASIYNIKNGNIL